MTLRPWLNWLVLLAAWTIAPELEAGESLAAQRAKLDEAFAANLGRLATRCDDLKLAEQARITRGWQFERDRARTYLFLADDSESTGKPKAASPEEATAVNNWRAHFLANRRTQAAGLFDLAQQTLAAHDPALAWQLLYEVLHEDPEHAQARAILGYQKIAGRWRQAGIAPVAKPTTVKHPRFGWLPGKYWRIETAHYEIVTSHSPDVGLEAGRQLEELYTVWRQLFVRFWADEEYVKQRFASPTAVAPMVKKFQVVLFRDRQEYVNKMNGANPQIGITLGFYADRESTAYFFAGDEHTTVTWRHEGTHQLFQEVGRGPLGIAEEAHVWIVEGIALYMESLQRHEGFYTVGGVDAERLQYARYRALTEKQHLPLAQLAGLGREAMQRDPRIRQLYGESAGMVQFLMQSDRGRYREKVIDYLKRVYSRPKLPADEFERIMERPLDGIDNLFKLFLSVTDDDLVQLARAQPKLRKLCLSDTEVTDKGLLLLAKDGAELQWLGLAHTKASDGAIGPLLSPNLTQLDLDGTAVSDTLLATALVRLTKLEELDLSQTAASDASLKGLADLKHLRVLFLTGTHASDALVPVLSQLKELETLDLDGTKISPAGLATLHKELPKWKQLEKGK